MAEVADKTITVCGRCFATDERPNPECANCSPWSKVLTCCYLGVMPPGLSGNRMLSCGRDAKFEVLTVRREAGDGIMAGPDPYSDSTHACTAHVGDLLGHQPEAYEPESIYWHVRRLDSA
jgi:hypothetical protein